MIALMARKSNPRHGWQRNMFLLSPGWLAFGMLFISVVVVLSAISKRGYVATSKTTVGAKQGSSLSGNDIKLEEYTDWAILDLSGKLSVDGSKIAVRSKEAKQWTSSALGCPQRGMMYAQVMVPGYLIVLSYRGRDYQYHAGSNQVIYCNR
jgi:hypothetical protein